MCRGEGGGAGSSFKLYYSTSRRESDAERSDHNSYLHFCKGYVCQQSYQLRQGYPSAVLVAHTKRKNCLRSSEVVSPCHI